ncbi:MAG: 30S ribosomal protein S6 [Endomicrobium sp.]|jgi:small subunit ribosomal protein S6|nr:30S ribosomal protein S6 [Endomicrobium sp.]
MKYETTLIVSPMLLDDKIEKLIKKIIEIIENSGGKILKVQKLGKKKLTYKITKFTEGQYLYIVFEVQKKILELINNFLKLNEHIIRFMTVSVNSKDSKNKEGNNESTIK